MALKQRFRRFAQLSSSDQRLVLKAACLLVAYSASLRLGSFKRHTARLHHSTTPLDLAPLDARQAQSAMQIGSVVSMSASAIPWRCRCLVQSLVVQYLLKKEQVPGQMHIGVSTSAGDSAEGAFGAHAWVQCGDTVIHGEKASSGYTVISSYAWD